MIGKNGLKHHNMKEERIVIFENPADYDKLLKLQKKYELKIITTNFSSYEKLKKNNIKFINSDSFLTQEDRVLIQKTAFYISEWYTQSEIKNFLIYKNVNLGSLIKSELIAVLVNFLKIFYELYKINIKFKSSIFLCSGIHYEILKSFSAHIEILSNSKELFNFLLPLNSLKYGLKIGTNSKNFELKIPKNLFSKMKSMSEKFSNYYIPQKTINPNSKPALFIELNTLTYENFLKEIDDQFVIFNRRIPSIWNKKTLSLIKNSSGIIENKNSLISDDLEKNMEDNIEFINKKISSLFETTFFTKFFHIGNISFWKQFSPYFTSLFMTRVSENILEIELAIELFKKYNFSSVVINNEVGPNEKIIAQISKSKNIPIFLNQHGLIFDTDDALEMNKNHGVISNLSDYSIVWGDVDYEYREKIGFDRKTLFRIGTPIYENFNSIENFSENNYVLLATSGPTKENIFDLSIETIQKNIQTIESICQILTKLNKKLIIKLHPSPDEFDPSTLIKKINPDIKIIKSGNISSLIKNSHFVIVIDFSTVILDAHLLKKPVISITVKNNGFGTPFDFRTNSSISASIGELEETIVKLDNQQYYDEIVKKGEKASSKYLTRTSDCSKNLYELVSKSVHNTNE